MTSAAPGCVLFTGKVTVHSSHCIKLQVLAHADFYRREAQEIQGGDVSPTMACGISEDLVHRDRKQLDPAPFDASISASLAVEMQAVLPSTQVSLSSFAKCNADNRERQHTGENTVWRCL